MNKRTVIVLLCSVWLLAAGTGAWVLSNYQAKSGSVGEVPATWPADSSVKTAQNKAVLLMFVHPQCPCTRASLEELNQVMAHCRDKVDAHAIFIQPDNMPKDWTQTSLWQNAASIPGVQNQVDTGAREARRFGAESSGYVLLYDAHGKLLFHGGITAGRGHVGENDGENAIIKLVNGESVTLAQTPVFGCGLLNQN